MKTPASPILLPSTLRLALTVLAGVTASSPATILTFNTSPAAAANSPMPQDYGDNASALSQLSANGLYQNQYDMGTGWTPNISLSYSTQRAGEFPSYYHGNEVEWPGVCKLWSSNFRAGAAIGSATPEPAKAMPAGFEYYFTFTPGAVNKGVILNSFVLDDRSELTDSTLNTVQWRLARGTASGPDIAFGSASFDSGQNILIETGMTALNAVSGPVVLVIKRMAGTENDLAVDDINFNETGFPTVSYNTGSLDINADGINTETVVLDQPGAIAAYQDFSTAYGAGARTTIPWQPELNSAAASPFTIEFWIKSSAFDGDDAPVGNRVGGDGPRSGWVFFQRDPITGPGTKGWNFRMYDGIGTGVGWDLTGGSYTLNTWCHVAAVWTGSSARLYVNGALADSTNEGGKTNLYVPNAQDAASFYVGALIDGASPATAQVDEVAFYASALTEAKLLAHFNTASSPLPGAYSSLVKTDGALLYLQQNPPGTTIANPGLQPTVTFTGVLSQSPDLNNWTDLNVLSPYTPPSPRPGKLFFRAHR